MNRSRPTNRPESFNRLMIYVKLISLIQFIIFTVSFYYSIKFLILNEPDTRKKFIESISYIVIVLELLHVLFAFTYFPKLNKVIREDYEIKRSLLFETFLFANLVGLILTLLSRKKQILRWKSDDINNQ